MCFFLELVWGPLFVTETGKRAGGLFCPDALLLFSFIAAGANVQTLRMRLIDALESHRDTWPPACPPLDPAKYFGLGEA